MYSAVGRSTTIASTSPDVRACLTWSLSLNGDTGVLGSMVSWAAVRLVVPTIAPIFRAFRSAMLVASAAGRPLERHDGLRGRVVRRGEVEVRLALVADRHLVDREVEVLGARRDDLVEAGDGPLDVVLVEAELVRHGVRDRGLEALAAGRVAVDDPGSYAGSDVAIVRTPSLIVASEPSVASSDEPASSVGAQAASARAAMAARVVQRAVRTACSGVSWGRLAQDTREPRHGGERSTGAPSKEREQPWVTGTTTA